ncbi:hypothetical protein ILUMI_23211 [Ignelater luminosus]|uniref:RecA family profile 1 domain-containing protein n=1 Tax=Ignelater luminosus TaxID=2038154 RepID=A0A8K0C992_IGNLU|nr:hypothetical protein ILUMI_23211 [Ignelater luminosus]
MARLKPEMHPLLTEEVINFLFGKNIYTVVNFLQTEIKQICCITNLAYKEILGIRKHLIHKNSAVVRNGLDYYKEMIRATAIIPTGIQNVDAMLEGGLLTGNIYEICGLPSNGKTQFCLTIAKNVTQKLQQHVYYIDTKRDFSGRKILRMLDAEKLPADQIGNIMSRILVKQINTKYELLNCLYSIQKEIDEGLTLRLIIIDSLPPLFYQTEESAKNYGVMNQFVNIMRFLAREYHLAFIVTNCITIWYEGDFSMEKAITEKLGLGRYWLSIANFRIMIKQTQEICKYGLNIVKSNKLPKGVNCTVNINDSGMF